MADQLITQNAHKSSAPLSSSRFVMILGVTAVLFFLGLVPFEAIPEIPVDIDSKPFFIPLVLTALLPAGRPGMAVALGTALGEGLRDMMEGYELDDPIGFIGYVIGFAIASYVIGERARNPVFLVLGAVVCAFVQAAFEASSFLFFGTESMGIVIQSTIGNTITHGVIWGAIPILFLVPALYGRFERFLGFAPKGVAEQKAPLAPLSSEQPANPDALMSARALQFRYPAQADSALVGVDIDLLPFKVTGLVGHSEAGKSTLCKVLAGLAPKVTGGELTGEIMQPATGPDALRIGYVADDAAAMMTQTRAYMEVASALGGSSLTAEEMEKSALDALAAVGVNAKEARKYIWELPAQKQSLVSLVAATVATPNILILDELPAQLDKTGKALLRKQISRVTGNGGAVLLVDNDVDRQLAICDYLAILDEGKIVASGHAAEILADADRLSEFGIASPLQLTEPQTTAIAAAPKQNSASFDGKPMLEMQQIILDDEDGNPVLRDANLVVRSGSIAGIAGAYNSGKSELARMIAGLAQPKSGDIKVAGDTITDWSVVSRLDHVATVIHSPFAFFSEPTVKQEIGRSLRGGRMDETYIASHVAEYAAMLGLGDVLTQDPLTLPFGTAKRVQIAAMLPRQAPLLVLDKALGNLDSEGLLLMHKALRSYIDNGGTVLLLDHDMDILSEWTDQLVFLSDGVLHAAEKDYEARLSQISRFGLDWPHAADIAMQRGQQAMTRAELLGASS
ncbi:MAG: ATP-binding cassette domain-containing protein [Pseudomonadota bacterium]